MFDEVIFKAIGVLNSFSLSTCKRYFVAPTTGDQMNDGTPRGGSVVDVVLV